MMTEKKKELEIYIHIPFCVRKCAYCDFLSGPAQEEEQEHYVEALLKEIQAVRIAGVSETDGHAVKDCYEVTTVFIGGGTPSILPGEAMEQIMNALRGAFFIRADAEITMEMNAGTVDREKLRAYKRAGINRLSIGLQSADDRELQMLGRIHTFAQFLETYEMAREEGFDNINIDLISALPGQTEAGYEETVQKVIALVPEHISSYSLIIEEGTPFYERYGQEDGKEKSKLPDEDTEREMYERTKILLEQVGYHRYEISNYALPGRECRHNIGYWERREYLGFGIGAASLLDASRFSNISDRREYVKAAGMYEGGELLKKIRTEREMLSERDQMGETMMLGLRMMKGVSKKAFAERFGKTLEDVYGETIEKYLQWKLLEETADGCIRFTEQGISVSNPVLAEFL